MEVATMTTPDTQEEIEQTLGQVPSWMEHIAAPAGDHSWGLFRDLTLGETELSPREKGLIGVGVAAAISCPYCTHFHREEARLADVTESELEETVSLASLTRYFSTTLHGNEIDMDEFVAETADIVDHLKEQEAAAAGAD
ncbi:alkylhydroperoxidase [Natrialba hulunbeirensis JCM 10989]|uniref:Alkylhydroperoxidase n=2 Tax=Natrialba hulunbeirensis TaxID=123783 RepID=L9ZRT7_9EURY|nr:alkylhydroperoxidase [Natrialba hulunbeirensis JCM 10989]